MGASADLLSEGNEPKETVNTQPEKHLIESANGRFFYGLTNGLKQNIVLLPAAFFIFFSASAGAGRITPDFVLGVYGFRPVQ